MDVIVNFTPTGMIPTKEMTPHVPVEANDRKVMKPAELRKRLKLQPGNGRYGRAAA